jgi:L-alanine-DL-glutamate epimerase-like enolase superfamily enzyme
MKISDIRVKMLRGEGLRDDKARTIPQWSLVSIVTDAGIEGTHVTKPWVGTEIRNRFNAEKERIVGLDPLNRSTIENMWKGFPYMMNPANTNILGTLEICLWDIAGKYFKVPVSKLLGQKKDRILAYASVPTFHAKEDYIRLATEIKRMGFRALKIHPPLEAETDIEVCKAVRETVGDEMILMLDSVSIYNRPEALKVGRAIDRLDFLWYEDPLPTTDLDGLEDLCRTIDCQVLMGERLTLVTGYTEYIRRHATDALRCSAEQLGGISAALKVANLAECFGMNCEPHSWGHVLYQAASLHAMLSMDNCNFFELPFSQGILNTGMKDIIRINNEGYVIAPTKPGLGFDLDEEKIADLIV